jgi:hypothetical protein
MTNVRVLDKNEPKTQNSFRKRVAQKSNANPSVFETTDNTAQSIINSVNLAAEEGKMA